MQHERETLCRYRLERAKEDLQAACVNHNSGLFKAAINRSYYAIFHSIRAVNILDGFDASKHSSVIAHFNQYYVQVSDEEYSTLDAMRACTIPVLFVHGTEDKFVPIEMTYENHKACSAPKRLVVVPGAEHGMSYFTDPKRYESALREFWEEFDK